MKDIYLDTDLDKFLLPVGFLLQLLILQNATNHQSIDKNVQNIPTSTDMTEEINHWRKFVSNTVGPPYLEVSEASLQAVQGLQAGQQDQFEALNHRMAQSYSQQL